jgi:hypothetical protein
VWCDLLHPARKDAALTQLRRDMQDHPRAVSLVQYALAYDRTFDPTQLEAYLQRRDAFGGLSDDELRAALSIRPPGMIGQPLHDLGMLVRGVIVGNGMDDLASRHGVPRR